MIQQWASFDGHASYLHGTNDFDLNKKPPVYKMLHKQEHLRFPTGIELPQENIRRFKLSIAQTRHVFQQ